MVLSSTLNFILLLWKLSNVVCKGRYNSLHFSFAVTNLLYRNEYSSATPFFVILISFPL